MTRSKTEPPTNMAASVKARLLKLAQRNSEDFNALLTRYVMERFLHRLAISEHANDFVLKGAMLFTVWSNRPHRATKDIDFLGFGTPDPARLANVILEICMTPAENDGVSFHKETIEAAPIREEAVYDGIRVKLIAHLGTARLPMQIDIGFGDATEPAPVLVEVPTLLDHPSPKLRGYRREVSIAEKLHAMVDLGMNNSRMKDYFDIWFISQHFQIEGADLGLAIGSTFARRKTNIPSNVPTGLTTEFAESTTRLAQWEAFTRRTRLAIEAPALSEVVRCISELVRPFLSGSPIKDSQQLTWKASGPWTAVREQESKP